MRYDLEVNGQERRVSVTRRDDGFAVTMGDRELVVRAAAAGGQVLSLLIERRPSGPADAAPVLDSHEVLLSADPLTGQPVFGVGPRSVSVAFNGRRRIGQRDPAATGAGPQRIVAPMPGKVVRLLAQIGDTVTHRQPLIVIEAMKMENELRASRDGALSEVLVREGQSVEAGTLLAIITPS